MSGSLACHRTRKASPQLDYAVLCVDEQDTVDQLDRRKISQDEAGWNSSRNPLSQDSNQSREKRSSLDILVDAFHN